MQKHLTAGDEEHLLEHAMAAVAAAMADPSRLKMLCALMDGPETRTPHDMRFARTCYDHLAGEVAVQLYDAMVNKHWLAADGSALTAAGKESLDALGIRTDTRTRRKTCCACLDWSERRCHIGGHLGAALLQHGETHEWLTRTPGYRVVTLTPKGRTMLNRHFDLSL